MSTPFKTILKPLLTGLISLPILVGCASDEEIRLGQAADRVDAAYESQSALVDSEGRFTPDVFSLEDGYTVQNLRVRYMTRIVEYGEPRQRAGYKIAAGSAAVQKRFNISAPITGVLIKDMLLDNESMVSVSSGQRLVHEADFLVRVGDEAINEARSLLGIASALDKAYAYIELPDLIGVKDAPPSGAILAAFNAGARWGVLGDSFDIENGEQFLDAMQTIGIEIKNGSGETLSRFQNKQGDENPLHTIPVLLKTLSMRGERLNVGDLISIGSFSPLTNAVSGETITVHYNLSGDAETSKSYSAQVSFTD